MEKKCSSEVHDCNPNIFFFLCNFFCVHHDLFRNLLNGKSFHWQGIPQSRWRIIIWFESEGINTTTERLPCGCCIYYHHHPDHHPLTAGPVQAGVSPPPPPPPPPLPYLGRRAGSVRIAIIPSCRRQDSFT